MSIGSQLFWVFIGGGVGSIARLLLSKWANPSADGIPWGTFLANMIACTILGLLIAMDEKSAIETRWKLGIATGFCGGFSTFSTFGLESLVMIRKDEWLTLLAYVIGSVTLGILCVYLGKKVGSL